MPVPDFQSIMLPLLRLAGDGKEHLLADARSRLGAELKLTQAEQDEVLPSGGQTRFANRVAWAKVYLERGGLVESPQRGRFIISPRGREVLNAQPARIDVKFLAQYPEFREFQKAKRQTEEPTTHLTTPPTPKPQRKSWRRRTAGSKPVSPLRSSRESRRLPPLSSSASLWICF